MSEGFLGELWDRKVQTEKQPVGLEELGKEAEIYEKLKDRINNLPDSIPAQTREGIEENFRDLQDNILRYIRTIFQFSEEKEFADKEGGEISVDRMEQLSQNRSLAHNALIDQLNILERIMRKAGLDTSWRAVIGYDREDVKRWAQGVSRHLDLLKGGEYK